MNIVITGASKGIGKEIAKILINKGHKVINISRTNSHIKGVINLNCDITDSIKLKETFNQIKEIDCLINNAGSGISGAIQFQDEQEIRKQFDINYFSSILVTKFAIPYLIKSKGKIIFTSSLASVFAIPFQSFYSSTKSAIDTFALALKNELKMFEIEVCSVRLGDVKTDFTINRSKNIIGDDIYEGRISKSVHKMELDEQNGMDPKIVANFYNELINKKHLKAIYTIGFTNKLLVLLGKILPINLVNKIVNKLYIKK